jgi:hypothetical protein
MSEQMNGRELAFVEHPDALLDPVAAYIAAGYSPDTAQNHAYRLRKKFYHILVEKARTHLEGLAVTSDWVKNEVTILAKTAIADFLEFIEQPNGNQALVLKKNIDIEPDKWRAAIKEVTFASSVMSDGSIRSRVETITLYDRQKAIMDLARLLGMTDSKLLLQLTKPAQQQDEIQAQLLKYATIDELKEISSIFDGISERLQAKANKLQDKFAIDHDPES